MKIDRLIGILSVLLQEEKMTAPKLAEKFEVSRRTINRKREVPIPDLSNGRAFYGKKQVKAMFDPSMKWHLVEEFGINSEGPMVEEDALLLKETYKRL